MEKENACRRANKNSVFKVIFLIEDTSLLGSSYVDKEGIWRPVILAHSKEFLALLGKSPLVDAVVAVSAINESRNSWFIDRTQVEEYLLEAEDYAECRFMVFRPIVIGFKQVIPDK